MKKRKTEEQLNKEFFERLDKDIEEYMNSEEGKAWKRNHWLWYN